MRHGPVDQARCEPVPDDLVADGDVFTISSDGDRVVHRTVAGRYSAHDVSSSPRSHLRKVGLGIRRALHLLGAEIEVVTYGGYERARDSQ